MDKDFVAVAHIKRAVGLKGDLLIRAFSSIESILEPKCLFLKQNRAFIRYEIRRSRLKGEKDAICLLENIDDRKKAEKLQGLEVFQKKALLPRNDPDEYFWYELKGLRVQDIDGEHLGKIHAVIDSGAQDVLVVRDSNREILIPMVDQFIHSIDIEGGTCVVRLVEGLVDATTTKLKRTHKK